MVDKNNANQGDATSVALNKVKIKPAKKLIIQKKRIRLNPLLKL
jgi:hypothetical protein